MKSEKVKYWIPVVLWMGFTFLMSTSSFSAENTSRIIWPMLRFFFPHITPHQLLIAHEIIRKCAHLTEYFVLSLLLFRAFKAGSTERHAWRWAIYSVLVVVLFASSDEFHQTFVATRGPSIYDVGVDTFGGILAQGVRSLTQLVSRRRRKSGDAVKP